MVVVLLEHELTSPVSVQFTVADSSASEFTLVCVAVCKSIIHLLGDIMQHGGLIMTTNKNL